MITIQDGMVYYDGEPQPLWIFRGENPEGRVIWVPFENGFELSLIHKEGADIIEIMLFDRVGEGQGDPHWDVPVRDLIQIIHLLSKMPSSNHPDANWEDVWYYIINNKEDK